MQLGATKTAAQQPSLPAASTEPVTPSPTLPAPNTSLPKAHLDAAAPFSAPAAAGHDRPKGGAASLVEQLQALTLQPATPPVGPVAQDVRVGLVYDTSMELHVGPESHWERPARTATLFQLITDEGLAARCWRLPARKAKDAELLRAHNAEHLLAVASCFDPETEADILGDMYHSAGTPAAALMAAGCTIEAAERVMSGDVTRALAVVRPPGHHAECNHAMGFCFFNNVALAALAALERGAERVLILDWDVHHGNGTQHILESDPRVLYMSVHRGNGFFPGTGAAQDVGTGPGTGFTVNVPWSRGGAGDADYLAAWELVLGPIAACFAPQVVLVSAGFDAAQGDPLGGCNLTPHGYGRLTEALLRHAGGKCVLALEGGYNTRATSEAAAACLKVLLGGAPPPPDPYSSLRPLKDTAPALFAAVQAQVPLWPVLAPIATKETFNARWTELLAAVPAPKPTRVLRSKRGSNSKLDNFVILT